MIPQQPQQWLPEERTAELEVLQQDQENEHFTSVSTGLEPECVLTSDSILPSDTELKTTSLGIIRKCTWSPCTRERNIILWIPTTDAISRWRQWYDCVIVSGAIILTATLILATMGYGLTVPIIRERYASLSSSRTLPSDYGSLSDQHFTGFSPMNKQHDRGLSSDVLQSNVNDGDIAHANDNMLCAEVTDGAIGTVAAWSTVPGHRRHYEMLRSWIDDRTARIVSRVQAVSQVLGSFLLRLRTVAYSCVDALLVSTPELT